MSVFDAARNASIAGYTAFSMTRYAGLAAAYPTYSATYRMWQDKSDIQSRPAPQGEYAIAAFATDLKSFIQNPEIWNGLREWNDKLAARENILLWPAMLAISGDDKKEAVRRMAALFQDVTPLKTHTGFLKSHGGDFAQRGALLETLCQGFPKHSGVQLYPLERDGLEDCRNMHHFYVTAYLTLLAAEEGLSPRLAAGVSALMNFKYEFYQEFGPEELVQTWKDALWPPSWSGLRLLRDSALALFAEPLPFVPTAEKIPTLRDMYLGVAGAFWAVGLEAEVPDFDVFTREFSENPRNYLNRLLGGNESTS